MISMTDRELLGMLGALLLSIASVGLLYLLFGSAWYFAISFYVFFYIYAKFWWKYLR